MGEKEACSISEILWLYALLFSRSCLWYRLEGVVDLYLGACELKTRISRKVVWNLFPHRPLAFMSNPALSSLIAVLCCSVSPLNGCK